MNGVRPAFILVFVGTLIVCAAGLIGLMNIDTNERNPVREALRLENIDALKVSTTTAEQKDVADDGVNTSPALQPVVWPGGRFETHAGFSLELPAGTELRESQQNSLLENGHANKAFISAPSAGISFSAILASADYGVKTTDGCCDEFHGTLNLNQSMEAIRATLEGSLKQIYDPKIITLDGHKAIRFVSPFSYASTDLFEHVIFPTSNADRPYLHFIRRTNINWGPDDSVPTLTDETVRKMLAERGGIGLQEMLKTVKLIPIPAQ